MVRPLTLSSPSRGKGKGNDSLSLWREGVGVRVAGMFAHSPS